MINRRDLHRFAKFWLLSGVVLFASQAQASRVSFETGGYTLAANSGGRTSLLGSIGVFRLAFQYPVHPQVDLHLGYTIATSKVFSGELAYGLDLGASWYFLTRAESIKLEQPGRVYTAYERLRPFASLGFYQRQYQSLQAGFAGFGLGLGLDVALAKAWTLRLGARGIFLFGPNSSSLINLDYLLGTSFQF
jgi:hypothetical protein